MARERRVNDSFMLRLTVRDRRLAVLSRERCEEWDAGEQMHGLCICSHSCASIDVIDSVMLSMRLRDQRLAVMVRERCGEVAAAEQF